jgi:hypothetical protein
VPAEPGLEQLYRYPTQRGPGLYLGTGPGGLAFAPPHHALLVLGPTRAGKTSGVVVPNVLAVTGAVVSTSTNAEVGFGCHAHKAPVHPRSPFCRLKSSSIVWSTADDGVRL